MIVHNFLHSSVLSFVSPKLHLPFVNLNTTILLCGLEIKRLSQLLKNKQKQDEMQTEGWLTSKGGEVHTFHATLAELCYFYKSIDIPVSSDFHFQFITVKWNDRPVPYNCWSFPSSVSDSWDQIHWQLILDEVEAESSMKP